MDYLTECLEEQCLVKFIKVYRKVNNETNIRANDIFKYIIKSKEKKNKNNFFHILSIKLSLKSLKNLLLSKDPKELKEQVESYAKRKGWSIEVAERWLAPNLGYDNQILKYRFR